MVQVIDVKRVWHRYGRVEALRSVSLTIPEGAFYALLGPNGAGKTTLLRIVAGLLRPSSGGVQVFGRDVTRLAPEERSHFTFVGEALRLPRGMTLGAVESYLAPLYERWDRALADVLRRRFRLDPSRRLRTLSRGEQMKAALLCVLAPRPRLLVMDEPFTGMDVLVKDELVSGVLDIAAAEGCTVLVSSHDLAELELIADSVGFLDAGELRLSESMESVRERFRRVELTLPEGAVFGAQPLPADWLSVEWRGPRATFLTSTAEPVQAQLSGVLPAGTRIEERGASLREVFVALAKQSQRELELEEASR